MNAHGCVFILFALFKNEWDDKDDDDEDECCRIPMKQQRLVNTGYISPEKGRVFTDYGRYAQWNWWILSHFNYAQVQKKWNYVEVDLVNGGRQFHYAEAEW